MFSVATDASRGNYGPLPTTKVSLFGNSQSPLDGLEFISALFLFLHAQQFPASFPQPYPSGENGSSMKSRINPRSWSVAEDARLKQLVNQHGCKSWTEIGKHFPQRSGKQCRERWFNHLNPEIKRGNWSLEEDLVIIDVHRKIGSRWSEISKMLGGRTDNSIKNRWNSAIRKAVRTVTIIQESGVLAAQQIVSRAHDSTSDVLHEYCIRIVAERMSFELGPNFAFTSAAEHLDKLEQDSPISLIVGNSVGSASFGSEGSCSSLSTSRSSSPGFSPALLVLSSASPSPNAVNSYCSTTINSPCSIDDQCSPIPFDLKPVEKAVAFQPKESLLSSSQCIFTPSPCQFQLEMDYLDTLYLNEGSDSGNLDLLSLSSNDSLSARLSSPHDLLDETFQSECISTLSADGDDMGLYSGLLQPSNSTLPVLLDSGQSLIFEDKHLFYPETSGLASPS